MTSKELFPEIGRRLAAARMRRGLSQGTVARRAGIAPSYLSRVETGKVHPTFRTVERIAHAIKARLTEITGPEHETGADAGPCPVTARGHCLLDLIRPQADLAAGGEEEAYSPRQVRLLSRFAGWLRDVKPDRMRAMEILLEDLGRVASAPAAAPSTRGSPSARAKAARGRPKRTARGE